MKVRLLRGEEARRSLADPEFVAGWQRLADDTPWLSTFQSPAFCRPWYEAYASRIEPVLLMTGPRQRPEGLMPLAVDGERLFHAGDHQCEYQGWLALPHRATEFGAAATAAALEITDGPSWTWKWLAPGLPVGWSESLEDNGIAISRERSPCPLLDVADPDALASKSRGRLRSHHNHFRKRGLRYERLGSDERAHAVLDRLALWCDLRQGAAHDVMPFASDPAKLAFHHGLLQEDDTFWLSALWLGEKLLAAHLGPFDGQELAMGIQAYDPREGRRSPGAILILEMAADLAEAGGRTLDLTPGGDRWKERWATHHREIERVELRRSRMAATLLGAGRSLERGTKHMLRQIGADPARIRARLEGSHDGPHPGRTMALREVAALPDPGRDAADGSSPEHELERLVVDAAASLQPDAATELLAVSSRWLAEGWSHLEAVTNGRLDGIAWSPPAEGWVDLGDLDMPRCRRDQPKPDSRALPEDVLLIRLLPVRSLGPDTLLEMCFRIAEARSHSGPIWLLADETTLAPLAAWLRPVAHERMAIRAGHG